MLKPSRAKMARDHFARVLAERKARLEEVRRLAEFRTGDPQAIFGRITLPGEHYGIAPINSCEQVVGTEESQELTRAKSPWEP